MTGIQEFKCIYNGQVPSKTILPIYKTAKLIHTLFKII